MLTLIKEVTWSQYWEEVEDFCTGLLELGLETGDRVAIMGDPCPEWLYADLAALSAGMTMIYAILLAFTGLIFWSPGFYFTWVFNALFQLARYPVNLYPGWLRLTLTWVLPVAFMTTIPAQALIGTVSTTMLIASLVLALVFLAGASAVFRIGLRQYASVSS